MSSDRDIFERLRTDPVPPMHVDLAEVVAEGRRRTRRRTSALAMVACAAAATVIAIGSALLSSPGSDSTTPAGTSGTTPARTSGQERTSSADRSGATLAAGRRTLTVGDAAYTLSVGDVLTVDVVRDGHRQRHVAGLVGGSAAWRAVDGTDGRQVLVGIVPGRAGAIDLHPVAGRDVPKHTVTLSPGMDFTAFVVTFAQPLDTSMPVADIGWSESGPATSWILGTEPQTAGAAVTMAGEGAAPLPPYDLTRTGPAAASAAGSVVISIDMPDARIGTTATATLQGDLVVKDPSGLTAQLQGADPETALARGVFQLTDGRTFAWGVAPRGAEGAVPHLEGGARAGTAVLGSMMDTWTAYAVQIEGTPAQVTGLKFSLDHGRGPLEVIE